MWEGCGILDVASREKDDQPPWNKGNLHVVLGTQTHLFVSSTEIILHLKCPHRSEEVGWKKT